MDSTNLDIRLVLAKVEFAPSCQRSAIPGDWTHQLDAHATSSRGDQPTEYVSGATEGRSEVKSRLMGTQAAIRAF